MRKRAVPVRGRRNPASAAGHSRYVFCTPMSKTNQSSKAKPQRLELEIVDSRTLFRRDGSASLSRALIRTYVPKRDDKPELFPEKLDGSRQSSREFGESCCMLHLYFSLILSAPE